MPRAGINRSDSFAKANLVCEFQDDFLSDTEADHYTVDETDTGATLVVLAGEANGEMVFTTGATDNNQVTVLQTSIPILLAAGKPIEARMLLSYTEAATNAAAIVVGLCSEQAADFIVDLGVTLDASHTGAYFFKKKGNTTWSVGVSHGTSQSVKDTLSTAGGGVLEDLIIRIDPVAITTVEISFFHGRDGGEPLQCRESGVSDRAPAIKFIKDFSTPVDMGLAMSVKAGGTDSEVVSLDYWGFSKKR